MLLTILGQQYTPDNFVWPTGQGLHTPVLQI